MPPLATSIEALALLPSYLLFRICSVSKLWEGRGKLHHPSSILQRSLRSDEYCRCRLYPLGKGAGKLGQEGFRRS